MDPETLEIDGHISQHSIHHLDLFSNKQPADAIILKTDQLLPKQQQQTMVMEIDANNIKHEQSMKTVHLLVNLNHFFFVAQTSIVCSLWISSFYHSITFLDLFVER